MNEHTENDRIEKEIRLDAPVTRVWRALTDHREFGQWFRVAIDEPFEIGKLATGNITCPGYENVQWQALILRIEAERCFAFTWHPYAIDPDRDYSGEPSTLVEFTLEPAAGGTRLRVVESGFDHIPAARRAEAWRMNDGGWSEQMRNIKAHVD